MEFADWLVANHELNHAGDIDEPCAECQALIREECVAGRISAANWAMEGDWAA